MPPDDDNRVLEIGPLQVWLDDGFARVDGRAVILTEHEFKLLVALARRAKRVVSRDDLYREVWGDSLRHGDRSVDVYIYKLRSKLERALPGWGFIHTHTGWGYRLDPEWRRSPPRQAARSEPVGSASERPRGSDTSRRSGRPTNYAQGRYT